MNLIASLRVIVGPALCQCFKLTCSRAALGIRVNLMILTGTRFTES
jgi:hypothetical protein